MPNPPPTPGTIRLPIGEAQKDCGVLSPRSQNTTIKCFNCGQPCHTSADCPWCTFPHTHAADHEDDKDDDDPLEFDGEPHFDKELPGEGERLEES